MSRVALIGENSIEYIRLLLGIWNNNDCAVLIDCQIPPQTAITMMVEAAVEKCYVENKYYDKLREYVDESIAIILYNKEKTSAQLLPREVYEEYCENYSKEEAIVIYSSGTTGNSRGIILSHFAISTNADSIIDYMQPANNDCLYIVRNLTHSSTIIGELMVALKTRMSLLVAPVVVPPRYVFSNIKKFNVTLIGVNPLLLSMFSKEICKYHQDISSLRTIYVSGSILSDAVRNKARDAFYKQNIYNVYGLSEAGPRVTAQRKECCKNNSVGKAIKGIAVAVIDENGKVVHNNALGIIHVNTPCKYNGYIHGADKHKSLYENWLNTGDVGYFDEDGELHIVGRSDNVININGHKIYPEQVQNRICEIEDEIDECVVCSVNIHENDILCCLYVSHQIIPDTTIRRLRSYLSNHEVPKHFIKTSMIPKSRTGKFLVETVQDIVQKEVLDN